MAVSVSASISQPASQFMTPDKGEHDEHVMHQRDDGGRAVAEGVRHLRNAQAM
jgi:hypothetical protein